MQKSPLKQNQFNHKKKLSVYGEIMRTTRNFSMTQTKFYITLHICFGEKKDSEFVNNFEVLVLNVNSKNRGRS